MNGILTLIAYICIALSVLGLLFVVFVLLPGEHTEPTEPTSAWTDQFKSSGYTDEEMKDINDILTSLGLTELHIEEYIENERMTIVLAKIYNSDNMQLNLTFEDHVLIYAQLTGIVETSNSWSNRTDKLKLGVGLQGSSAVDMYSDTEGGILAVLDWEAKSLERVTYVHRNTYPGNQGKIIFIGGYILWITLLSSTPSSTTHPFCWPSWPAWSL